ncbi:MAG: methyltransferase [Thermoplasmata archaeon]|uniref:tRNA (guanine(10)-N(2))-dimethyltransferase n=1 Tax=Candidatus Sysuiplasma superficiale TaxID=2823368 RepID=A0A8J8CD92_9ARCH|nr:methyltransferase [Candidatus Sysuiplasma superficiale]MBX8643392.1 methyltransferase [Candidatus Sysuiplasma superficiale]MCL4346776.1 methyltransferase domain-containing protein [Candidatus Thermoplasmatota archaeon]MCL5437437.1 methyltransferase domain-containing protein [Candidatus Thermoplasmatota archaeon]
MEDISLIVELSLEHSTFPFAELESVCNMLGCSRPSALMRKGIAAVSCESVSAAFELCRRLAFSHSVSLLHGTFENFQDALKNASLLRGELSGRTFSVRIGTRDRELKRMVPEMEREFGKVLSAYGKVKLTGCDVEVLVFIEGGMCLLTTLQCRPDRRSIDRRKAAYRPFFSPVSLPPRYARALVNLCGVSEGDRIIDPFCGTGGILMEAVQMGITAVGSDLDPEMVEGTERNLREMGIAGKYELHCLDVSRITELGEFDAVITDPPYGRSSTTNREDLSSLYRRTVEAARAVLVDGGMLGMVVPDPVLIPLKSGMTAVYSLKQKVHRSLTRHYIVMRKDARSSDAERAVSWPQH